jgi:flagellin
VSEIDRIANNSQFNGIKLLDGSFQNQSLQVGAGNDANDRIAISIGSAKVSALGIGSNSSYSRSLDPGDLVPTGSLTAGSLSINGAQIGASATDGLSFANAEGSAIAKAAAINAASGLTGVTAKISATTLIGNAAPASGTGTTTGDVLINGVDIGPIGATTGVADRGTQVAAAINAKSSQTGVTATASTSDGRVTLKAADGRNITVATTTAGAAETGLTTITGTANVITGTGGITGTAGFSAGTVTINSVDIGLVANQSSATDLQVAVKNAINSVSFKTGVVATLSTSNTSGNLILTSVNGKSIAVTGIAGTTMGTIAATAAATGSTTRADTHRTASLTLSTNSSGGIVIGGSTGAAATGQQVGFQASVLSSSGGVDLSTAAGSQAALSVLDTAINTVTDSRASMGAYQNRLTASVANLETTSMNLQASRSRILDTDYAKETTNLAKSQIIQQAATAMLAQANQSSQSVLSLLK